jgi:uncharacterized repeat protein (TIGR03803 family)
LEPQCLVERLAHAVRTLSAGAAASALLVSLSFSAQAEAAPHIVPISTHPAAFGLPARAGSVGETLLHSFSGKPDGEQPIGGLLAVGGNAYFGTTQYGGTNDRGSVFRLRQTKASIDERVVYSFRGNADGYWPSSALIADGNGALYGTTPYGGYSGGWGSVYKLTKSPSGGYAHTVIYSFQGDQDGYYPLSALVADGTGAFYGATYGGGDPICECGVVYKLTPSSSGYAKTTLYRFLGQDDGAFPQVQGSIVVDQSGDLIGVTCEGGRANAGTVYQLTPSGSTYTERVLYFFRNRHDGGCPWARVTLGSDGNIYGTTADGGTQKGGTIFALTPNGSAYTEKTLYAFPSGSWSAAGLVQDKHGNLYGSTQYGANQACDRGCGMIFELRPKRSGSINVLYQFQGGADASQPEGELIVTPRLILGVTNRGGAAANGTVFALSH